MDKKIKAKADEIKAYKDRIFDDLRGLRYVDFQRLPRLLRYFVPNRAAYKLGELRGCDTALFKLTGELFYPENERRGRS